MGIKWHWICEKLSEMQLGLLGKAKTAIKNINQLCEVLYNNSSREVCANSSWDIQIPPIPVNLISQIANAGDWEHGNTSVHDETWSEKT